VHGGKLVNTWPGQVSINSAPHLGQAIPFGRGVPQSITYRPRCELFASSKLCNAALSKVSLSISCAICSSFIGTPTHTTMRRSRIRRPLLSPPVLQSSAPAALHLVLSYSPLPLFYNPRHLGNQTSQRTEVPRSIN